MQASFSFPSASQHQLMESAHGRLFSGDTSIIDDVASSNTNSINLWLRTDSSFLQVLHNVLKAPEHLQYQLAFLSHELREIFAAAPLPSSVASALSGGTELDSKRKAIEGSCPICFIDFSPDTEQILYCKATCGNNVHETCFEVRILLLIYVFHPLFHLP